MRVLLLITICFIPLLVFSQTKTITNESQIKDLRIGDNYNIGEVDFTDPNAMFKLDEVIAKLQPLIDAHFENLKNGSEDLQKFTIMCRQQKTIQEFKKEFSANRLKEIAREVGAKDEGRYSELMDNIKKEIEDSN